MQATYRATDLANFVTDLVGVFRSAVERANLTLTVDVERLSEPVFVDRDMMEKIIYNLLSNALKCTLKGGITVQFRRYQDHVKLSVSDTGLGIGQSDLCRVFERFYRVEVAGRRSNEGTGIGLALTEELVKLHGGRISVQSELGIGSTFTVVLPLGKSHLPKDRVQEEAQDIIGFHTGSSAQYVEEAMGWLPTNPQSAIDDLEENLSNRSSQTTNNTAIPFTWTRTAYNTATSEPYIL